MYRLKNCSLCPRNCNVNRLIGQKGYCKEDAELFVARAALHMWEEPCISGENGSGTVFFSGCSMRCVFCQNYNIANGQIGKKISIERLSDIFIELQQKNAANINLVTPTHYVIHIIEALKLAKVKGLKIPIVYNSSGYESVETLKLLNGIIDIYLPDFKYFSSRLSEKYSNVKNYFDVAKLAIDEMVRQRKKAIFIDNDENNLMRSGVIVRHLLLPTHLEDSKKVIKYLYEKYGNDIYISIMNQYTPMPNVKYDELNQKVSNKEYEQLVNYAIELGVENGFIQEGKTAGDSFIPQFNYEGV